MRGRKAIEATVNNPSQLPALLAGLSKIAKVKTEENLTAVSPIGKDIGQNPSMATHAIKTLASASPYW